MARTPILERTGPARIMGAGFIGLLLFFGWLTYAFFNHTFESSVPMHVESNKAGLSLPSNADVKIRGMIVGEVRDTKLQGDKVRIDVALNPEDVENVPADSSARIVPKTLFGQKYIDLLPPEDDTGPAVAAGDTIDEAEVPAEIEDLLTDLQPLLEAVRPADLKNTLTAMSQALDGRGEQIGDTLVELNDYVKQVNPDIPQLVTDIEKTGEVSDVYNEALPDIGNLLSNSVVTADTVVEKQSELAGFFAQGTEMSETMEGFLTKNEKNLLKANDQLREPLEITKDYSDVFPCFLDAMAEVVPILDSAFRDDALHINVYVVGQSLSLPAYEQDENAVLPPKEEIYNTEDASPEDVAAMCPELERAAEGEPDHYHGDHAFPGPAPPVYEMIGLKKSHQEKFGADEEFNRAPAQSQTSEKGQTGQDQLGEILPSLDDIDSEQERKKLDQFIGTGLGIDAGDVPDIGTLMVSPLLRGTEVTTSGGSR